MRGPAVNAPTSLWIDLETTGLVPQHGVILEIAAVAVDDEFQPVSAYTSVVGGWPTARGTMQLPEMPADVIRMHSASGLLAECAAHRYDIASVGRDLSLWFYAMFGKRQPPPPLGGSSVHFDRAWLRHHLPDFERKLLYRNIDVSGFNEVARRVAPSVYDARPKADGTHRAMPDILASLEAARYYAQILRGTQQEVSE